MYLIGLSTIDYVVITLFFTLYLLSAYLKKSSNDSYSQYINIGNKSALFPEFSFGFLEIVSITYFGAMYGISALYFFIIVIGLVWVSKILLTKLFNHFNVDNVIELLNTCSFKVLALFLSVVNILILISVISLIMDITYTSLYALLGWHFSYSVYALFGVCLIGIVLGGRSGLAVNKILLYTIVIVSIGILLINYFTKSLGGWSFVAKLQTLAVKQQLGETYYTSLFPLAKFHLSIYLYGVLMYFMYIINHKRSHAFVSKYKLGGLIASLIVLLVLVMPALIALTTQPISSKASDGRSFVTQETQFSDGQMGYIIKAVDKSSDTYIEPPGIVPPFAEKSKTLFNYDGNYNYSIANLVAFEYYVPSYLMVFCLLMIIAGFLLSVGDYLLQVSTLTVENLIIPTGLINKYGIEGRLWSLRIALFGFSLITLVIAKLTVVWFGPLYG